VSAADQSRSGNFKRARSQVLSSRYAHSAMLGFALACVALTACGGSSRIARSRPAQLSATSGVTLAQGHPDPCADGKKGTGLSAAQLEAVLRRCGAVGASASQQSRPERHGHAQLTVVDLIAEFAACMRHHGVNVPPPTRARPDPQLESRDIDVRSSSVRAASARCNHYLAVAASGRNELAVRGLRQCNTGRRARARRSPDSGLALSRRPS